ncbi:FG-GAP-like repeat-containing protein [Stieleria sp. JC731]|uniref:FG-GAP-like repeat-containing protein n=1 Tax=Pirellulaceae TaxID=2691357 RepID=UPI001E5DB983|nr:FG-GAP-like repeat-containing protein [Stieleria sp. JC731]MCC9604135.1 FG-GAP-like repeat-containing protein [Stieleria sp. JC731]
MQQSKTADRHLQRDRSRHRACFVVVAMLVAAMVGGCHSSQTSNEAGQQKPESISKSKDPGKDLHAAVQQGDWQRADQLVADALIASPEDPDVLTDAAITNGRLGRERQAADLLVQAVAASNFSPEGQRVQHAVQALVGQGRLYDAIELLSQVVNTHPKAHQYRRMLVGFLGEAQLTGEIPVHMEELIRARQFDLMLLMATTETSFRRFSSGTIDTLLKRNPSDLRPLLGRAQTLLESRDVASAESLLRRIIKKHPSFGPAHALLGQALVAQGKAEDLPDWFAAVPADASEFCGYWIAVGQWAMVRQENLQAARGFSEATRADPSNSFAWSKLADVIATLRQSDLGDLSQQINLAGIAEGIAKRREALLELRQRFATFADGNQQSQAKAVAVAEGLADLGRYWEAEAWLAVATTLTAELSTRLQEVRSQVVAKLSNTTPWLSRDGHPELSFDVAVFPAVKFRAEGIDETKAKDFGRLAKSPSMENQAERWGLRFYGEVGDGVEGPRVPIHQTLGCGGGVIDFDLDGKQDLCLAAAGGSIGEQDSQPAELFRNLGDSFAACGAMARVSDKGFSHGVCVGDYNDDGFADLLVLNLGRNRLFRNNGDGSFSDASDLLGDVGVTQWSSSGAIADLDEDGFNDFFIVNYCDATEPLDQPCYDSQGNEINCYPLRFRAAADECLKGQPDGTFQDVTKQWLTPSAYGRGLGIVVGHLDGTNQAAYVANDASVNHLYRKTNDTDAPISEVGISAGLAVDGQSLDQGSMGIASWDFDNDGDLDFYVTGFAGEYNILYEQKSPGLWADSSAMGQLVAPTLQSVAFGTEAVDLDNDGYEELLVTNGHIGDFGSRSPPYAQMFQVFRQHSANRWETLDNASLGEYFATPHVGRSMMTLDANRDGLTDCVITHATEPVALLINQTDRSNRQIGFQLVDTAGTRDAVGAIVRFDVPLDSGDGVATQRRTLHRLAGHGYLCSNQSQMVAGVGQTTEVENVVVTWPDGVQQQFGRLQSGAEYLIVRDHAAAVLHWHAAKATNR